MSRTKVGPIVKWAGGKTRLLPEILKHVPESMSTYAEPFVGGGALFFALANESPRRFKRAILSDSNRELIALYRVVQKDVGALIRELRSYRYAKREYLRTRKEFNTPDLIVDPVERAACFLYLNRACYNGLYRVNRAGQFNVPFGRYKNPTICDEDNLRAAERALVGVRLQCGDFAATTTQLGEGDFAYFDPPYTPLSDTAEFTAYTPGGFTMVDQARLAHEFSALKRRGVGALLSNADVPLARALYKSHVCVRVKSPRSINCDGKKRGDAAELLITTATSARVRTGVAKRRAA